MLQFWPTMTLRQTALHACFLLILGCNRGPDDATSTPPPPAPPPPSPVAHTSSTAAVKAPATVKLGEAISAPEVRLADVAKDPTTFAGRAFTTHGTVTSVCQEMGCWMEIKDADNGAHMRMHGHSFFVPKDASGRTARVQATLVPSGSGKTCADEGECASKNVALLQLDATGVELD
jgi:Domain of unknown function (DUF4920)